MNRPGVLATAGGAVAIGLAPVVPLLMAHNTAAFAVPDVHFYAVSTTAILCAALALGLGVVGMRRHDRRSAAIGAGFTVMAALLAVHGPDHAGLPGRVGYYAAVGVSGALAVPLGGAVILATLLSRPRSRGHVRDLVYLQAGVVGGGARVRMDSPCSSPSHPGASRSRCARCVWWIVGVNALVYGVLALRALRTFQLTRRVGDLAVVAGLAWLAIAVATYLLSPTWSVGFWSRPRAGARRLRRHLGGARERSRPRDARRARSPRSTSTTSSPRRRSCSAPGSRACSPGSPSRTPRRASTRGASRARRPRRPGARAARQAPAQPRRRRAAARRGQAAGAGRRSSARPRR